MRKFLTVIRRLSSIPLLANLKTKPLCQSLLNALEISRKTALVSQFSSKDKNILRLMASNWLMVESPGLKPDRRLDKGYLLSDVGK